MTMSKKSTLRPEFIRCRSRAQLFTKLHPDCVIVADQRFKKDIPKQFSTIFVRSGEELKTLKSVELLARRVQRIEGTNGRPVAAFVAIGGGSVGDGVGFLASVWKRGVPLIMVPTTYLAAIDSAHGGKTGVNLGFQKNVLGTFHFAAQSFLVDEWLFSQPEQLAREALSELVKICLINPVSWTPHFLRDAEMLSASAILKKYLLPAVKAKWNVVDRDPFELRGERIKLNLGHTFGHAFERQLRLSHGEAVGWGLLVALEFSCQNKMISRKDALLAKKLLFSAGPLKEGRAPQLSSKVLLSLVGGDKKKSGSDIRFVFSRGFKASAVVRPVSDALLVRWFERLPKSWGLCA